MVVGRQLESVRRRRVHGRDCSEGPRRAGPLTGQAGVGSEWRRLRAATAPAAPTPATTGSALTGVGAFLAAL